MNHRPWGVLVALSALAVVACGAAKKEPAAMPDPELVKAFPNLYFEHPTDLVAAPDGSGRLFVLEQAGRIRVFPNEARTTALSTYLDLRDRVASGGEMGLLGLAFDPDFKTNRTFYVNYTADNPRRTVIARFHQRADGKTADPEGEVILTFEQPYSNHNGGQLAFGPDGYLYIGTGDGGGAGDPERTGQDRSDLLGSWLRIDVHKASGGRKYAIPPDNPYVGNGEGWREEVYAYGLRNLWRFSYDPETKRWWGADVGQNRVEEVDVLAKGRNYGWSVTEGTACYRPQSGCDKTGITMPVAEYSHDQGNSITGGYVYRGQRKPELQGAYIYADFGSGRVWALRYDGEKVTQNQVIAKTDLNISSFGLDADRELYALGYDGFVYHFE